MHHVVSDAWTRGILDREIGLLYAAFHAGEPSPLPALPVQYADYAEWQRCWLDGESLAEQLAYWKKQLAGAPASLDLPANRPRPPLESHRGDRRCLRSLREVDALGALSRRASPCFMTLLGAFDTLLFRYTGQLGSRGGHAGHPPDPPRDRGADSLLLNNLVLRTRARRRALLRELLARVRETCLGAYAHQELPFSAWCRSSRSRSAISAARPSSRCSSPSRTPRARPCACRGWCSAEPRPRATAPS